MGVHQFKYGISFEPQTNLIEAMNESILFIEVDLSSRRRGISTVFHWNHEYQQANSTTLCIYIPVCDIDLCQGPMLTY